MGKPAVAALSGKNGTADDADDADGTCTYDRPPRLLHTPPRPDPLKAAVRV
jgi:hypothetical protein